MLFNVLGEVLIHCQELRQTLFTALCTDTSKNHVDPSAETVSVRQWQAHHLSNNKNRNVLRVLHSCVNCIDITHVINELVANLFNFFAQWVNHLW